jgi:hypothetical protein
MTKQSAERRLTKNVVLKSRREVAEPMNDWIPIGRAIFQFGIASDPATTNGTPKPIIPFASRAFEHPSERAFTTEPAEHQSVPPSVEKLIYLLQAKTQAREVVIDQNQGLFHFSFVSPGGGAIVACGTPWEILAKPNEPTRIDPRSEAEALFSKTGLVRVSDDEAAPAAGQFELVRQAAELAWRRYMLPTFDRAVLNGRIRIYARVQSVLAPFQELPRDLWPQLDVFDWGHGNACDAHGALYHSLHAADAHPLSLRQQSIARDEGQAIDVVAENLRHDPALRKSDAWALLLSRKLQLSKFGFQSRIWPQARVLAGMSPRAAPGRKKKS